MKKYILFSLLIFPILLLAQEENLQIWEKANAYYTTEEYNQAISLYEQIVQTGKESAELYFNLGNAYYKAGDV